jgi:hypothetical protein
LRCLVQRLPEEHEAFFGNRREERVFVFEVMVRGPRTDPGGAGRRAEREPLRSPLFDEAQGRIEERPPEITVVVRLFDGSLALRFFGSTHS